MRMNLRTSWIIAAKDLKIFRRKKNIILSTILLPLLLGIVYPLVFMLGKQRGEIPAARIPGVVDAFSTFFVICAATLPTAIASYSIVGEKVEKSLEPLLATPTTDGEILLGKSIAAFLPPALAIYTGATIYMVLTDMVTYGQLSYLYFPNWSIAVTLLIFIPLAAILSIEGNVIASSRVNDVRTASQIGGLMLFPFLALFLAAQIGAITLNTQNLLIISAVLLIVDVALFYVSTATFRREEILTKWK
jgi:ABC-2 type transport system permease protein